MASSRTIAVGLIGLGRIGRLHAENLTFRIPQARLKAAVEPSQEALRSLTDRLPLEAVHESPDPLFEDPTIEAVVICSPTDTHACLIERAARAGKHIFCEKPIALDLAVIDVALAAVERAAVKLQIGFNRRFDPNFRRIREGIEAGEIGQPHLLRITSRDPGLPSLEYLESSGGLFLDMTIHDFDMARYLIGDEAEEIYAVGGARVDPLVAEKAGDIDTAIVTLKFAGGAFGTIDNSRQAIYGYDQRVEVFGSEGALRAENTTPHSVTLSDARGVHGSLPFNFFKDRYRESYLVEMRQFISCLLDDGQPLATGLDGRISVAMALAAKRSQAEHRPVRLAEVEPES